MSSFPVKHDHQRVELCECKVRLMVEELRAAEAFLAKYRRQAGTLVRPTFQHHADRLAAIAAYLEVKP